MNLIDQGPRIVPLQPFIPLYLQGLLPPGSHVETEVTIHFDSMMDRLREVLPSVCDIFEDLIGEAGLISPDDGLSLQSELMIGHQRFETIMRKVSVDATLSWSSFLSLLCFESDERLLLERDGSINLIPVLVADEVVHYKVIYCSALRDWLISRQNADVSAVTSRVHLVTVKEDLNAFA